MFPHLKVDEQPNKKPKQSDHALPKKKRERRLECSGYCENFTTIGLRLARLGCLDFSKRQTVLGNPMQKVLGSIRKVRFKTYTSSKRKTRLHSTRSRKNGSSRLREQKSREKESLWWIPELVCTWSARKTLTLLSWRP